jgi:hypothetical protein
MVPQEIGETPFAENQSLAVSAIKSSTLAEAKIAAAVVPDGAHTPAILQYARIGPKVGAVGLPFATPGMADRSGLSARCKRTGSPPQLLRGDATVCLFDELGKSVMSGLSAAAKSESADDGSRRCPTLASPWSGVDCIPGKRGRSLVILAATARPSSNDGFHHLSLAA